MLADIVTGLARAEALWRPHVAHDPDERVRRRLLATPAYEVWLLGWTPGQSVGLHDHGDANGAFVVVDGELVETTRRSAPSSSTERARRRRARAGAGRRRCTTSPTARARNATSIHAYSRPLTAMGFYGADGALVRVEAVHEQSTLVSPAEASGRCTRPCARSR